MIRAHNLLKGMIDMMSRLLDYLIYLGGGDDLVYTKTSCYIKNGILVIPNCGRLQLSMTPEFQQEDVKWQPRVETR